LINPNKIVYLRLFILKLLWLNWLSRQWSWRNNK